MKNNITMLRLRQAVESSWRPDTAYQQVEEAGNPALGQCYVTARIIQHYLPEAEIVEGEVVGNKGTDKHFWNVIKHDDTEIHIDWTWQQFPAGSVVTQWKIRDRTTLNDSQPTIERVERLLNRVERVLGEV